MAKFCVFWEREYAEQTYEAASFSKVKHKIVPGVAVVIAWGP